MDSVRKIIDRTIMALAGAIAVATLMSLAVCSAHAQGVRAVSFINNNYIWHPGFPDNSLLSPEGVVSFWYASSTPPTTANPSTIAEAWSPQYQGWIIYLLSLQNFVNDPYGLQDGVHVRMFISDGKGATNHFAVWVSNEVVRFDGEYHNVAVAWDTNTYDPATHQFAAIGAYSDPTGTLVPLTWNAHYSTSDNTGQTFSSLWTNAPTYVAAHVPLNGSPTNFFRGNLAQIYGHAETGDYQAIQNLPVGSRGTGFGRRYVDRITGQPVAYLPEELGDNCENPLSGTTLTLPMWCLRGGMPDFLVNQGGATSFRIPAGVPAPATATSDPWRNIP